MRIEKTRLLAGFFVSDSFYLLSGTILAGVRAKSPMAIYGLTPIVQMDNLLVHGSRQAVSSDGVRSRA
jgi:hypothetical protein